MVKIIVTGAGGQVGSELQEFTANDSHHQWVYTDVDTLDLTNADAIQSFIAQEKPDVFVHLAAYTAVDKAESEQELAMQINGIAPGIIADACKTIGAKMIQVSTDYVFNGESTEVVTEDAPTDPQSVYGSTKLEGERRVQNAGIDAMIIRTAWVYSYYGHNFVKTMQRLGAERDEISVVFDQIGTPTYAKDLAGCIYGIIANDQFVPGTYHYSNEGVISWYDFAQAIMELSELKCKVLPIRSSAFPTPAKRPNMSVLDKSKIKTTLGIEVPYWRDSLKDCLARLK